MSVIETIKQRILELDAGPFQNMCNAFLSKEGYGTMMSLGSQAGTQKTTKGTPDTYFVAKDGRYIFVEYTTQQSGIAGKIQSDIQKCFDTEKTKVPLNKISEIIYCHTSSNLTPGDDLALRKQCEDKGIALTLFGIDQLANQLYLLHRNVAKEYLGISMGTGQIKEFHQFIKDYDANELSAPLNTLFCYREEEMEQIGKAFQTANVVILTGRAGVGKSRLALHFAETHAAEHQETLFCIRSNAQPIYEDLIQHINAPGNYFLFVDDANELSSGLQHILAYATGKEPQYQVRVLITVRDYAAEMVYRVARPLVRHETIDISVFSDDQIKKLIRDNYGITNPDYLDRIASIAEGNARIAMLAGSIAKEANRLDSIDDLTSLFACYYGSALAEKDLNTDHKLLVTAGIAAFLSPFDCKKVDSIEPILEQCFLSKDDFIEKLYELHEKEIVQFHFNQIVRFEEQCLGNYILKLVFVDKRLISLSDMIRCCFVPYQTRVIQAIGAICGVFRNHDIQDYVEQQITSLWKALERENAPCFHDFVKAFHLINPTDALVYIHNRIEASKENKILPSYEEIQKAKNYQNISDDVLTMLGSYADTQYLDEALDLFFLYYSKCCGNFMQFYHAALTYYNVNPKSFGLGYYTQIRFVLKLREYADNWKDEPIRLLFTELAPELLKLEHTVVEGSSHNRVTLYQIKVTAHPKMLEYRSELWKELEYISSSGDLSCIEKVMEEYGNDYSDNEKEVIIAEAPMLHSLINSLFDPDNLKHCLIVDHMVHVWSDCDCVPSNELQQFTNSSLMECYRVLEGPGREIPYDQREKVQKAQITQYIKEEGLNGLRSLIDTCAHYEKTGRNTWSVGNGLRFAFEAITCSSEDFAQAMEYYISRNTPLNLNPMPLIEQLFGKYPVAEVHQMLFDPDYDQKNYWQYAYFAAYPKSKITSETVAELYSFLSNPSDVHVTTSPYRDLWFIEKYKAVDPRIFITVCEILLRKFEYSPFIAGMYSGLFFNDGFHKPEEIIKEFSGHIDLLAKLYILTFKNTSTICDLQGAFARALLRVDSTFVDAFAQHVAEMLSQHRGESVHEQLISIFDEENAHSILDRIVETTAAQCKYAFLDLPELFDELLLPVAGKESLRKKQDEWMRHLIKQYANDTKRMRYLFETIGKLSDDRRIGYIILYLEYNPAYEDFEKLPLIPSSLSWCGSAVPMYSRHKECMMNLGTHLTGIKYLKHRKHVQDVIARLQADIEREQLHDILTG